MVCARVGGGGGGGLSVVTFNVEIMMGFPAGVGGILCGTQRYLNVLFSRNNNKIRKKRKLVLKFLYLTL